MNRERSNAISRTRLIDISFTRWLQDESVEVAVWLDSKIQTPEITEYAYDSFR